MKKRNRAGRRSRFFGRQTATSAPARRGWRKRNAFTFERLEERNLFSATPLGYHQPGMSGELTQEQVSLGELYWAVRQAGVLSQYDQGLLETNTQWVVLSNASYGSGASIDEPTYSAGLHVIETSGMTLDQTLDMFRNSDDVLGFYPMLPKKAATGLETDSFLDEPLFPFQWHLRNTGGINVGNPDYQDIYGVPGEDINVVEAWNRGYTGAGVIVAVADSGVQMDHPDLIDNINTALAFDFLDFDTDPSPPLGNFLDAHGTSVAGIIAADGDNGYGGTGVAPNAEIVPLRILTESPFGGFFNEADLFAYRNDVIDIFNHSWGPGGQSRDVDPISPAGLLAIRESVLFGRQVDGLAKGVIHVFSAGNGGGHDFGPGFPGNGWWDSAMFDGYSPRYVITVGGIDHDGGYFNVDGTLTNYPESGPNVLVVAPTGSVSLDVSIDTGTGSGIFTTDTTGDDGFNVSPLPSGFEVDRDFLDQTDFTSRFNGTSASTPMVSGVVALMLEANPNLNYRDVQEILLRSARYVDPTNEGWEVNYREIFQDPVPFDNVAMTFKPGENPFVRIDDPTNAVNNAFPIGPLPPPDPNIFNPHPIDDYTHDNLAKFSNGAGYSLNQGVGIFEEQTGWSHGVVDAGLAVKLAEKWHERDQDNRPEVTYTTFVLPVGDVIAAAEFVGPDGADDLYIIPGSWGDADREFGEYYDEFFADDDPMDPDDGPFSGDDPPVNDRGVPFGSSHSALPLRFFEGFEPPLMEIEWIEVKVEMDGPADAFNELRLAIKSPDGTISDLIHMLENDTSVNINHLDRNLNTIQTSPADGAAPFIWTFATNRHWGERTDDYIEVDPNTGDERQDIDGQFYIDTVTGGPGQFAITNSIVHGWEIIAENYSGSNILMDAFEVVFHGQRLDENSERIVGRIGIDSNQDGDFNYHHEVLIDMNGDGFITPEDSDIWGPRGIPDGIVDVRELDMETEDPEKFASNIVVQVFETGTDRLVDEFITGADGNFYFDLLPGTYDIKLDPISLSEENLIAKSDMGLDPRYLETWTITIDDTDKFTRTAGREVAIDADRDGIQDFNDANMNGVQDPGETPKVRYEEYNDVNFLLDPGAPLDPNVEFSGVVIADVNGNGVTDGGDTPTSGFRVYADLDGSGQFELGEPNDIVEPGEDGQFLLTVQVPEEQLVVLRAETDMAGWSPTIPNPARVTELVAPGSDPITDIVFRFRPPLGSEDPDPEPTPGDDPGMILGSVFDDLDRDGVRDGNEEGVFGIQVFADLDFDGVYDPPEDFTDSNMNGVYDTGEPFVDADGDTEYDFGEPTDVTESGGGYALEKVPVGPARVRIIVPSSWELTAPASGFRPVTMNSGGTITNVSFGLRNLATRDFGDLPAPYPTLEADNGPTHTVVSGFRLGPRIDGEVDGQPTAGADGDDAVTGDEDGVKIISNGGMLVEGDNTLEIEVSGEGGWLNAWMDLNGDGDWTDPGEQIFTNVHRNPGKHRFTITTTDLDDGPIASRFRWGTPNLSFTGHSPVGEVEDYLFETTVAPVVQNPLAGDYNSDGEVNDDDYALWKSSFGSTFDLRADGNGNNVIDAGDYSIWMNNRGAVASGTGSTTTTGSSAAILDSSVSSNTPMATTTSSTTRRQPARITPEIAARYGFTVTTVEVNGETKTFYSYNPSRTPAGSSAGSALGSSSQVETTTSAPSTSAADGRVVDDASDAIDLNLSSLSFVSDVRAGESSERTDARPTVDVEDDSELALLDDVLAGFAAEDDEESDAEPFRAGEEEDEALTELALAAVFDDETDWRLLN